MHVPLGVTSLLLFDADNSAGAGVGFNLPTQDLYDAFSNIDVRRGVTATIVPNDNQGRLYSNKFTAIAAISNDEDNNFMVLRYADVLLMLAEAANEIGYVADGDAFNYLNMIRVRAGISLLTSAELADQAAFRDAILLERRLELALENHRWFDLVRTNKAIEVMSNYVEPRAPLLISSHHVLFPIPQAQINILNSPNFLQNPGY
jgi:hypothetical protein